MTIDTKRFADLVIEQPTLDCTHYDGCELVHLPCAILFLAGALDAAQERLEEYRVEISRLRGLLELERSDE